MRRKQHFRRIRPITKQQLQERVRDTIAARENPCGPISAPAILLMEAARIESSSTARHAIGMALSWAYRTAAARLEAWADLVMLRRYREVREDRPLLRIRYELSVSSVSSVTEDADGAILIRVAPEKSLQDQAWTLWQSILVLVHSANGRPVDASVTMPIARKLAKSHPEVLEWAGLRQSRPYQHGLVKRFLNLFSKCSTPTK